MGECYAAPASHLHEHGDLLQHLRISDLHRDALPAAGASGHAAAGRSSPAASVSPIWRCSVLRAFNATCTQLSRSPSGLQRWTRRESWNVSGGAALSARQRRTPMSTDAGAFSHAQLGHSTVALSIERSAPRRRAVARPIRRAVCRRRRWPLTARPTGGVLPWCYLLACDPRRIANSGALQMGQ
jgi:hypothetical protein